MSMALAWLCHWKAFMAFMCVVSCVLFYTNIFGLLFVALKALSWSTNWNLRLCPRQRARVRCPRHRLIERRQQQHEASCHISIWRACGLESKCMETHTALVHGLDIADCTYAHMFVLYRSQKHIFHCLGLLQMQPLQIW